MNPPWGRATTILWLIAAALSAPRSVAFGQPVPLPVEVAWAALGVDLRLAVDRFEVRGRSLGEARRDLVEKGPRAADGSARHALTTYRITAQWGLEGRPEHCRVADASVTAEIRILLPSWSGAREATEKDYVAWQALEQDLMEHEAAHRDLALDAAHRLSSRLVGLEATTCPALDHRARAVVTTVNDALRQAQEELDRPPPPLRQARILRHPPGGAAR